MITFTSRTRVVLVLVITVAPDLDNQPATNIKYVNYSRFLETAFYFKYLILSCNYGYCSKQIYP